MAPQNRASEYTLANPVCDFSWRMICSIHRIWLFLRARRKIRFRALPCPKIERTAFSKIDPRAYARVVAAHFVRYPLLC